MITVKYPKDFNTQARTLEPGYIGTNKSGWTVEGEIHVDYYEWVNEFVATHPDYGKIEGDFETEVTAESQEALDHFLKNHPYFEWDYYDI